MQILGVIPARGGSKGIPHKNIVPLRGKPLIAYTINAALQSKYLTRTIVSTDDPGIAEIAATYGAEIPFLRPSELGTDDAGIAPVLHHAVDYLVMHDHWKADAVMLLQPTSPLRTSRHIDESVERFKNSAADTVVSVCEVREHPYWMWTLKEDTLVPFSTMEHQRLRRQDLPALYRENGCIFLVRTDVLMGRNSIYGDRVAPYFMDWESSADIDDVMDLRIADALLGSYDA